MVVLKTPAEMRAWREARPTQTVVGFVPTMGALHAGHMRLVEECHGHCDVTVVSIFVNPLQFGPQEDFARYPRPIEEDMRLLREAGVQALFLPSAHEFYAPGHSTYCQVEELDKHLCGASRSGHFRGVCTVVLKLFLLVESQHSYFGQKDIQQALILRRMIGDLALKQEMHIVPTVREIDGLAMSSRNRYLNSGERHRSAMLSQGLFAAKAAFEAGERDAERLKDCIRKSVMSSYPTRIDYIECVDQDKLAPLAFVDKPAVLALAVYFGRTRLIDNVLLMTSRETLQ